MSEFTIPLLYDRIKEAKRQKHLVALYVLLGIFTIKFAGRLGENAANKILKS